MARPITTATKDAALTKKQTPKPKSVMMTPPIAGPMTRYAFMTTVLRLTPVLGQVVAPLTISITND